MKTVSVLVVPEIDIDEKSELSTPSYEELREAITAKMRSAQPARIWIFIASGRMHSSGKDILYCFHSEIVEDSLEVTFKGDVEIRFRVQLVETKNPDKLWLIVEKQEDTCDMSLEIED